MYYPFSRFQFSLFLFLTLFAFNTIKASNQKIRDLSVNLIFVATPDTTSRPAWAGIWGIWGGENYGGPEWPWYKGTIITASWKNIEPQKGQWDFSDFDANLKKAADKGLYIGIKVYHGDVSPDWIYPHGDLIMRKVKTHYFSISMMISLVAISSTIVR